MKTVRAGRLIFLMAAFIVIMMTVSVFVSEAASQYGPITVKLDGKTIETDAEPVIVQNRTMVPVSAIVSAFGGTSSWDQDSHTAVFVKDGTTVKVTIGSLTATVNGVEKKLDAAPLLVKVDSSGGARTMVPLRFISEGFGYDVDWDNSSRTVIITSPQDEPAAAEPSYTILSTSVTAAQKISGNTSDTFTNVEITATVSLKALNFSGVWLTDPYRYYIDFTDAAIGSGASSSKNCSAEASYVTCVRSGVQPNNTVRIVIDMKSKITPSVSYSSDGKTMILSFKESSASSLPSENEPSDDNGDSGNGSVDQTLVDSDSLTDSKTVKHDSLSNYDPYADGKIVVAIDPGHGKTTGGKRSPDSTLMEWEFNRDVAYRLKSLLEEKGYQVIMTVSQDDMTDPSLASRVAVANDAGNVDLFVSIHGNANGNGSSWDSAHGWEIWIHKSGGASELAAKYIENATKAAITEFTDRGIKKTSSGQIGLYVSRNTEMPSVLIEHGFYTNYSECQLMKDDSFRQRLAQADADGIVNFFNSFR